MSRSDSIDPPDPEKPSADPALDPQETQELVADGTQSLPFRDSSTITPDAPPPNGWEHAKIGPYKILGLLGEGGMGTVYVAEQSEPIRRKVALKVVKIGMDTKEVLLRFEAERQALALMDHANIASVYEAGQTREGRPYFAMEHVSGVSLTQYCDRQRLTTRERLQLFLEVCRAIQHAHQKGIIHRDIKPSNILVKTEDGRAVPKVIDFGIAKATSHRLTDRTLHTGIGGFVGTPEYMSPEQADRTALDVDTRSDIYSLGIVLYELLTGLRPYGDDGLRGQSEVEIQRIIRDEVPAKPSTRLGTRTSAVTEVAAKRQAEVGTLIRQIRGELDWVTMKALEKDRTRRYQTTAELALDVQRYLDNEPVLAGPPSRMYSFRKFVSKHRAAVWAGGAFVAVLAVSLSVVSLLYYETWSTKQKLSLEVQKFGEVNAFLEDMLASADPNRDGRTVKVVEILDRAATQVERFDDEPEVGVALRNTLARTYSGLGLEQQAIEQLNTARAISRSALGANHPEGIETTILLAEMRLRQGRMKESEDLFAEALRGLRAQEASLDKLVHALSGLSVACKQQNRLEEASNHLEEALEMQRQLPESIDTYALEHNLARLLQAQAKFEAAEPFFRGAVAGFERLEGAESPSTLLVRRNLGAFFEKQKRYAEAEAEYRRSFEGQRQVLGPTHRQTLTTTNHLASAVARQGRWEEAHELYAELVQTAEEQFSSDDFSVLIFRKDLGGCLAQLGRYEESEVHLLAATGGLSSKVGDPHPATQNSLLKLVELYDDWQKPEEAEAFRTRLHAPEEPEL